MRMLIYCYFNSIQRIKEWIAMKVLVVGSNGQIGQHLIQLLKESKDHTVRAMVRNKEQTNAIVQQGVETVLADLEGTVELLAVSLVKM
jgi:uncharacterized protein YbjT (DUF2867 family)